MQKEHGISIYHKNLNITLILIHHELRRTYDFAVWINLELVYDFRGRQPWRNFLDFFFAKREKQKQITTCSSNINKNNHFYNFFCCLTSIKNCFQLHPNSIAFYFMF